MHGQDRRDQADQHDRLEGAAPQLERRRLGHPDDDQGDDQAQHRAGGVGGAVEAKGQSALALVDAVGHQGVARRGADPLAHAVGPAHGGDGAPGVGEVEEGLGQGRQAIAGHGQPLARPQPVRQPAGKDLEQAGRRLGDALDQADDAGPDAQHVGQEQGQDVDDHLAGDVGQKAGQADGPHVAGQ